jgi:hypothetical protein
MYRDDEILIGLNPTRGEGGSSLDGQSKACSECLSESKKSMA